MTKTILVTGYDSEEFDYDVTEILKLIESNKTVEIIDIKFSTCNKTEGDLTEYNALIIYKIDK